MNNQKPTTFIIFGGTGDLAKNKILPALFDLKLKKALPQNYQIVGFSRKDLSDIDYRDFVSNALVNKNTNYLADEITNFPANIYYVQGDIKNLETYDGLDSKLRKLDEQTTLCANKIFYLAVPPNLYETVFINLEKAELIKPCSKNPTDAWTRVLVEKPFGSNPAEAQRLDKMLGKLFDENQIFRIDHYLAKEALQNIIYFRFANPIFSNIWDQEEIERIDISLFETSDASDRGHFYDPIGALLDVGQNHVLQMLALVTMEDPKGLTAQKIRTARTELISRIVPASRNVEEYAFRAQYDGYKNEIGVDPKSQTDTFFQLKLNINNRRWKDVPIFVQSGKALSEKKAQIKITFKKVQSCVCPVDDVCQYSNAITIDIQPKEKITISFWAKKPGLSLGIEERELSFDYNAGNSLMQDAYEKVLFDCIVGDQTLFNTTEEVAMQWGLISNISEAWQKIPLEIYEKGVAPETLLKLK
jgi:glucose-6-phosphate 1-dehydrogenase